MSELYLITGFLGSGKTTFLRQLLPLFKGRKLRLIINEFGKEGIDGALLSDLQAMMDEISGGSVFCACRLDQFEKALRACKADETILVEASGLSDPTGVRKLFQTDRFPHITYKGAVCLADALRFPKEFATARTCVRQIAASDMVILNKTDLATEKELSETRSLISGQRPDMFIYETSFGKIPSNFLEILESHQLGDLKEAPVPKDLAFKRVTVKLSPEITAYELEKFISMFIENTFRVKGLIETKDQGLVVVDSVGNVVTLYKAEGALEKAKPTSLTVLAGVKSSLLKSLKEAVNWYKKFILEVQY